jgi:pseudouridine-5'-phosphate glycosidase
MTTTRQTATQDGQHSRRPSFRLTDEVAAALAAGAPVVALESTIIAHGLPWPQNLAAARDIEAAVRAGGAVPATIAVIEGVLRIGLDPSALDALARSRDAMKLSRADLAFAMATGRTGATTVAATMIAAAAAGIRVFATGGIGGVHRGAATTFDISADLEEFTRSPVTVVSAGAKAILDLPKTLEVLETKGVPVVGWRTQWFPAFWSRQSGLPVPLTLEDAATFARFEAERRSLGLQGGILLANPIPAEHEIPADIMEAHVTTALDEAERARVTGKDVTPFLLARILELTAGRSLTANRALILNNAAVAAEIATALARLDAKQA